MWPVWRSALSWNVTAKNYRSAALQSVLIAGVLALPPVARLVGMPGYRSAAIVLVFVASMLVDATWLVPRARIDRRWFLFMDWKNLVTGTLVLVALVAASGDPRSPLWACSVMYAALNGSDYDIGPSISVLLLQTLVPLLTIPLFALQGTAVVDAAAAAVLFGVLCGITYHYCALRSVVVRASIAERDALREELAAVREREQRTRIARDLHDAVGSSLSLAAVYADLLARAPDAQTSQQLAQVLAATTRTGLVDLRRTVRTLDDRDTAPARLADALRRHAELAVGGGIRIEVTTRGEEPGLSPRAHDALLRIFQEALQNCIRHASATCFTVVLEHLDGRVRLVLSDDGRGFDVDHAPTGRGLHNIHERARELGGEARIASSSSGTEILVDVPTR